jgi:HlyD family secretion protein
VAESEATLANARQNFNRAQHLWRIGAGTKKDFDAAEALLTECEARRNSLQTKLARRAVFSPSSGTIQQVYFRPGEMIVSGRHVLSMLPPGNIKLRFFVPEALLPKIELRDPVRIKCDGCAAEIHARISFISDVAQYTSPVTHSVEQRANLVFLIEARPEHPEMLRIGQPIRVALAKQDTAR